MYCIHCGQMLPDEAKFCFKCGKVISQDYANLSVTNDEVAARAKDIVIQDESESLDSKEIIDDVILKSKVIGKQTEIQTNITLPQLEQSHNEVEINNNDKESTVVVNTYPKVTEETFFGGSIVIKTIEFSENDIIYRICDSNGVFEEEFLKIKKTKITHLFIAKRIKNNHWVFLQVDAEKKIVSYGTKDDYNKLHELEPGLYRIHKAADFNYLYRWDDKSQCLIEIYRTLCWIESDGGSYYELCKSNKKGDRWQYGLIKYEYGKVETIIPVICDSIISCKSGETVVEVEYNNKSYCLQNDGCLYRIKPQIFSLLTLARPYSVLVELCIFVYIWFFDEIADWLNCILIPLSIIMVIHFFVYLCTHRLMSSKPSINISNALDTMFAKITELEKAAKEDNREQFLSIYIEVIQFEKTALKNYGFSSFIHLVTNNETVYQYLTSNNLMHITDLIAK